MAKKKRQTRKVVEATEKLAPPEPRIDHKPEIDDDDPCDDDGLNMRRRLFVEHITSDALGNATKAARLSGYADSNAKALGITACRLLGIASIQQAIARKLAQKRLTPAAVRSGIAEIAASDMANFVKVDDQGVPSIDWNGAAANGAISQIKEFEESGFEAGGEISIVKRKFKIYDRLKALELLARMHGMLNDPTPNNDEAPIVRMRPINNVGNN